jgi:AraC-like DNA-binding protein
MDRFTTKGLPARRKVAYWNELSSEAFAAMEITPRDAIAFDGELRRESIGPLTLLDVHSAAARIRHSRTHAARAHTPSYLLLTPLRGSFRLKVEGEGTRPVATGEFCLLDHARPYELTHGDGVRVLCVDIPRRALHAVLARPERAVGRIMRADSGVARMLAVLLRETGSELEPAAPVRFPPAFAQGLLGFVAAAYSADDDLAPDAAATRRRSLLARIDARLNDPTLSPEDIAREAGISARRLRAVLAAGEESFSAYLLRRRLESCADLLRDAHWRGRSITDIAFRNGFNNATHFGHAFKQRYGMTPSAYRQRD